MDSQFPEERSLLGNIMMTLSVMALVLLGGWTVLTLAFIGYGILAIANAVFFGSLVLAALVFL